MFDIADFREKLGFEDDEYPRMDNFKRFVLEAALKQINKHTDIVAEYEQHKNGRTISGISFKFKVIKAEKINQKEIVLTEKQALFFANKLAHDDAFSSQYAEVGESYEDLEKRLSILLADPKNTEKWMPDLERLGYST